MTDDILTIREGGGPSQDQWEDRLQAGLGGRDPGFKVGGSWRFERQEIARWIKCKVDEQQGGNRQV